MRYQLKLGAALRKLRTDRNMTLTQLSKLSGVQLATLSRMENDKMVGALESYAKIAKAYGMKLSELFRKIEEGKRWIKNK